MVRSWSKWLIIVRYLDSSKFAVLRKNNCTPTWPPSLSLSKKRETVLEEIGHTVGQPWT
jgi:hypothetical protein